MLPPNEARKRRRNANAQAVHVSWRRAAYEGLDGVSVRFLNDRARDVHSSAAAALRDGSHPTLRAGTAKGLVGSWPLPAWTGRPGALCPADRTALNPDRDVSVCCLIAASVVYAARRVRIPGKGVDTWILEHSCQCMWRASFSRSAAAIPISGCSLKKRCPHCEQVRTAAKVEQGRDIFKVDV